MSVYKILNMNQTNTNLYSLLFFRLKQKATLSILIAFLFMNSSTATTRSWTGAANLDFNNLLNWNPVGSPGSNDTLTIALTNDAVISLSSSTTIASLTVTMSGNNKIGVLNVGAFTLSITGTTTLDVPTGNANSVIDLGVNGGTAAGIVDFGGAVSAGATNKGSAGFTGNANSKLIFRSDLTFGSKGYVNATNIPGTAEFDASSSQAVVFNTTNAAKFNHVIIGNTNSPVVTVSGTTSAVNRELIGNLTVNGSSILDLTTSTWNRSAAGGSFLLNSTATLKLAASTGGQTGSNFPLNFSTVTLASVSTVEYNSAGGVNQTIYATPTYGHLTLSQGSGAGGTTKTAGAGLTVAGNFLINTNATFAASTFTHNMKGNWTNNGTFTQSTSTVILNGTANQNVGGSSANTFRNLTINNSSGVTLTANATVSTICTFTSGNTSTGANKLIIATGGTLSRTSGHVVGYLQKNVATGATTRTFEVGTGADYTPVVVAFGNVSTAGNLTASSVSGDHPDIANSGIDPSKSVNRNWSLTNSGILFTNYSATFNFVAGDIDGGATTGSFLVRKLDGGTWFTTTTGNQLATSTQATAMTTFSEFQVGEMASLSITCPADFSTSNDPGNCFATINFTGAWEATSTSTPAPTITYVPATGSTFAVGGPTLVTATATNINGSVNCNFNVTVNDDEDPVILDCPANIDVCGFVATWSEPTAIDNCSIQSFSSTHSSGDTFPLGTTTVTYTATDVSGNTSSCSFDVTTYNNGATVDAGLDQSICYNGTATLSGSIGGGATSSTWTTSGDGTFDDASLLNAVYTPGTADSANGTATLTLTTDDPAGPCTASMDDMLLTFNYAPPKPDAVVGPGPATACNTDVFTYTTNAVTAISYTWTSIVGGSASISSGQGTNTVDITFGVLPSQTSYFPFSVTATNTCGTSPERTFSIQNKVGVPIYTGGLQTIVCPGTSGVIYSVNAMPGASNYNWTVPLGASITAGAGTTAITVDFSGSFVSGNISVSASNACMTSAVRNLLINSTPSLPGTVSGPASACPATSATFSISPVVGASSYTWTVPTGASITSGQGTTSIDVSFTASYKSGNIGVSAQSSCVPVTSSSVRNKFVASPIPAIPASISGTAINVCGQTLSYTASAVTGATSYEWTVPAGCSITGNGSQTVSVTFPSSGFSSGDICVRAATTLCTSPNNVSAPRCLTVKGIPANPGVISGPSTVCNGSSYTFSVTNVSGLTYTWTVPTTAQITSGAGTNSINVLWGSTVGYVNVTAYNGCGGSNTSNKLLAFGTCRIAAQGSVSNSELDKLEAYPNPTMSNVTLRFLSNDIAKYQLKLMDITGREVMSQNGQVLEGENFIELNLNSMKSGIYIASVTIGQHLKQIRIVKQ